MSEQLDYAALREALAEYAHDAWAGWMKYQFSKGYYRNLEIEGTVQSCWIMPRLAVTRWQRQMRTKYADLDDSEKESDRFEADRIIEIMDRTPRTPEEKAQS